MGQEAPVKAAQLYSELSEEETCEDPDDNERVLLYEPFLFGLHTAEDVWKFCDEAGDKQGLQYQSTKETTIWKNIVLNGCDVYSVLLILKLLPFFLV